MSEGYPHLHPSTRPFAAADQTARIQRIRADRWIAYARANAALTALEDLLSFPKRLRMPNLLLVGPTNNGKTMIVEKFRRAHSIVEVADAQDGAASVPVVTIQMPAGPDEVRFFGATAHDRPLRLYPTLRTATYCGLTFFEVAVMQRLGGRVASAMSRRPKREAVCLMG